MGQSIKIVAVGVSIWLISLIWPEINQIVSQQAIIALILGLGTVSLVYAWNRHYTDSTPPAPPKTKSHSPNLNDSRPIKPIGMA